MAASIPVFYTSIMNKSQLQSRCLVEWTEPQQRTLKLNLQDLPTQLAALCTFSGNFLSKCSFELLWHYAAKIPYQRLGKHWSPASAVLSTFILCLYGNLTSPWTFSETPLDNWLRRNLFISFICHIFSYLGRAVHKQLSKFILEVL